MENALKEVNQISNESKVERVSTQGTEDLNVR